MRVKVSGKWVTFPEGMSTQEVEQALIESEKQLSGDTAQVQAPATREPEAAAMPMQAGEQEERVWTKAGGMLPDLGALGRSYKRPPMEALFPLGTESVDRGESPIKSNLKTGLDVLSLPYNALNYATGGLFNEGGAAMKSLVPDFGGGKLGRAVQSNLRTGIDIGTDPSTFVGAGAIRRAATPAAQLAQEGVEAAVRSGRPASSGIKRKISDLSKIDESTLQRAADSPELQNLGKRSDEAKDLLATDVGQKVRGINLETDLGARERISDINARLDEQIVDIAQKAEAGKANLDDVVTSSRRGVEQSALPRPEELNVSDRLSRGTDIETAVSSAKERIGSRFGSEQNKYLGPEIGGASIVPGGTKNVLLDELDNIFKEANISPDMKFKGIEKVSNVPITPEDLKDIRFFYDVAQEAKTTGDMLNNLRLVRRMKGAAKPTGGFYDSKILGEIDGAYQRALEKQIGSVGGPELADLWKQNNKVYSDAINAISGVEKKVGIGGSADTYTARIKNLGVEGLLDLKAKATKNPDLAQVWTSVRDGYKDNILINSMSPDGTLNADKLEAALSRLEQGSPGLSEVVFGSDVSQKLNQAVERLKLSKQGLSQTEAAARITSRDITGAAAKESKAVTRQAQDAAKQTERFRKESQFGEPLIGDQAEVRSRLGTVKQKDNKVGQRVKETLEILDDIYGMDFTRQAENLADVKALGVNAKGELPWFSQSMTGRAGLGSQLGSLAGRAVSVVPVVGKPAQVLAGLIGVAGQSPAGAVAIFRAIDSYKSAGRGLKELGPTRGASILEDLFERD